MTTFRPRLVATNAPGRARGAVLVLHGGASRGADMRVSPTQLSVLRMVPVARRIASAGGGQLAVLRVLNSVRGWGTHHTPLHDVEWALGRVREEYGDVPTCLVGHSLGGRAALLAGHQPGVRSVVALNPWVYPTDRPDLRDRHVLFVHGTADRVADPRRAALVAEASRRDAHLSFISVRGGSHAMLRHHGLFDRFAAQYAVGSLLGLAQDGPVGRALGGEQRIEV